LKVRTLMRKMKRQVRNSKRMGKRKRKEMRTRIITWVFVVWGRRHRLFCNSASMQTIHVQM